MEQIGKAALFSGDVIANVSTQVVHFEKAPTLATNTWGLPKKKKTSAAILWKFGD